MIVEIFRPIFINGEKTKYNVSDHGTIINIKTGYELKRTIGIRGYYTVYLYHKGRDYHYTVHRLVAEAFIPNPFDKDFVNHIDGDKLNPRVDNLEWVTNSENIKHAYDNQLISKEIKSMSASMYSDEQIKHVCELLMDSNRPFDEISYYTGVKIPTIKKIYHRDQWGWISNKYNFPIRPRSKYTNSDIHDACRMLEKGDVSVKQISDATGMTTSDIYKILHRKSYVDISSLYNIDRSILTRKYVHINKDQVRRVCELLDSTNYSLRQISNITDVPKYTVSKILLRIQFSDISKEYTFHNRNK